MSLLLDDETTRRKSREEALAEIPEELRQKMTGQLQSPDLFRWISDGLADIGIAGEHFLAMTLFLVGTSRLLAKPLAVIIQGPSSSGKSYVIEQVADLFPPETVLLATDITPSALYYMPPGELAHRFVVAGERARRNHDDSAQGTKALREMLSAGRLSKLTTISDSSGPRTEHIQQEGPIAYVESTTATDLFEEDANRCLVLQPDDRPEQTEEILQACGRQLAGENGPDREQLRTEFHVLQRLLEPVGVVIPFGSRLAALFPKEPIEVRRAFGQVTSLIQTIALLQQYQRGRDASGRVVAQPEDYWLARILLAGAFARSLEQQPGDGLRRFVEQLRERQLSGIYTAHEIAKVCRRSDRTVREYLQELLTRNKVEQTQAARGQSPAHWCIPADLTLEEDFTTFLPSVGEVCGCDEELLALPDFPAEWFSANLTGVPF